MLALRLIDSPYIWALVGIVIGVALEVTTTSAWLIAALLGAYLLNLGRHDPMESPEGWLVAAAPALMLGWIAGFVLRGWAF